MILMDVDTYIRREKKEVETIYHYTSTEAVINILNNGCIRFTNCLFLNDEEEFYYFGNLLEDILKDKEVSEKIKESIKQLKEYLIDDNHDSFICRDSKSQKISLHEGEYYIFSCSTDDDSLPMWNYYVKNSNYSGYSLKINKSKMLENFNDLVCECIIGQIVYNKKEQKSFIINYIQNEIDSFNEKMKQLDKDDEEYSLYEDSFIGDYQQSIYELVKYVRLFFKDNAFKHEKEYRIVLLTDVGNGVKKVYNAKNGIVTPCIEIGLDLKEKNPFNGIKVSPTIDFNLCKKGLLDLLHKVGINKDDFSISQSKIKIRY